MNLSREYASRRTHRSIPGAQPLAQKFGNQFVHVGLPRLGQGADFSGQLREDANAAPEAFAETWHLVKPTDGSRGWNVAGIQQV